LVNSECEGRKNKTETNIKKSCGFIKLDQSSQVINCVVFTFFLFFPESEVLLKKFDDALGVTEVILLEFVDPVESLLESSVCQLTGLLVVLHDFVVEDREVESESEFDWVARREGDLVCFLIGVKSRLLHTLELVSSGVLRDVAIVVAHHLDEESLWLAFTLLAEDLLPNHANDSLTILSQLSLNGCLVGGKGLTKLGVLWVLLDGGDGPESSAFAGDQIFEGHRKKVPLVRGDVLTLSVKDLLQVADHILEPLGLLSHTSEENILLKLGICHMLLN
jgi:hypothetical protein